ncbi:putative nitrogen fixation protein NifU-related protein [Corynebacterium maris DSM 45190]|uniref:Putative nitrogen fixation protein NifU-related protein n=1 Tax=Corynebacterium maris DSM 45190 TaxID=1224163 RepID=S5TJG0_9CORY|nr:SUF system NifU family Fe-S cluster assembly protein [Corynebacterium maris]AGS34873.1 putative nitrogen fixation protein NifU-related protein [Corynebacterium maris DSM 45190]
MSMEAMYQEVILDHYKHPKHTGLRDPYGAEVHHVNPSCGDEITLRVRLSSDGKIVEDVSYDAEGCSISQASTSVMTDEIIGQSVEKAMEKLASFEEMIMSRGAVEGNDELIGDGVAFVGVAKFPARVKCALLGWKAFQAATAETLNELEEK